jgi:hypothetical protein
VATLNLGEALENGGVDTVVPSLAVIESAELDKIHRDDD